MSVEISVEVVILGESMQFMKLGDVKHLATVPVITVRNARELTEILRMIQSSAEMYMIDRDGETTKDYIHIYVVIKDSDNQLVAIFSADNEHNYNEYMNKEVIDFSQMKYSNASTGLVGYDLSNLTYDYTNYQPQPRNANSNVTLVSLELEGCGKVNTFAQLDSEVNYQYNVISQTSNPINLVFLLEFSNGNTYRIPYTFTSADMTNFDSYKLLQSYCDLMKNCSVLFTERIDTRMNQVQLDALEMADFNW